MNITIKQIAAGFVVTGSLFAGSLGLAGNALGATGDSPTFVGAGVASGTVKTPDVRGSQAAATRDSLKAVPVVVSHLCTKGDGKSPNPAQMKNWPCSGVLRAKVSTAPGA